ncbi:MAG: hypothetical protein R3346_01165 [Candidatus Spechtbacterales bacterium]|nr:hypothetical protein [Candidatus Spechtbacterales bacterium]
MAKKLKLVGVLFLLTGLGFMTVGGVVLSKAQAGLNSLDAVYEAQGIELNYNDDGQLIDRGQVEGGNAILSLLEDDWEYPLNRKNLDPNDPLVNTPDELMVQFATISYHVLHGEHTVTLEEDVEYKGETYEAGEYTVEVDGRYYTDFDRMHPVDGPVRTMAWSPMVHGLLAEISSGVGADMQAGFAHFIGMFIIGLGGVLALGGAGLVMAGKE